MCERCWCRDLIRMHIVQLRCHFPVKYHSEKSEVVVEVEFPDEWTPTQGPILLELPEDYPTVPPQAYVIDEMEFKHGNDDSLFQPTPEPDWKQVNWNMSSWDESQHTLLTATKQVLNALEIPAAMVV